MFGKGIHVQDDDTDDDCGIADLALALGAKGKAGTAVRGSDATVCPYLHDAKGRKPEDSIESIEYSSSIRVRKSLGSRP